MQTFKGRYKDDEMEVVDPPPLGLIEDECVITDGQRYTLSTTPFARDHRILTDDNDNDDHLFPMSSDDDDVSFSVPIHITFRSPPPTPTKDAASKKQLGTCSTQDAAQLGLDGLQKKRARDESDTTPPSAAKKCTLPSLELGFDTEAEEEEEEEEEVIHLSSDDDVVMEKQVVFDRVSKQETCGKGDEIECVSHLEATEVMGEEEEEEEELKEKQVLFDQETCGKGDGSVTKCLIELLTVLGETSLGKGKEAEEVDFLETAKRKGYTFPNPRFL